MPMGGPRGGFPEQYGTSYSAFPRQFAGPNHAHLYNGNNNNRNRQHGNGNGNGRN